MPRVLEIAVLLVLWLGPSLAALALARWRRVRRPGVMLVASVIAALPFVALEAFSLVDAVRRYDGVCRHPTDISYSCSLLQACVEALVPADLFALAGFLCLGTLAFPWGLATVLGTLMVLMNRPDPGQARGAGMPPGGGDRATPTAPVRDSRARSGAHLLWLPTALVALASCRGQTIELSPIRTEAEVRQRLDCDRERGARGGGAPGGVGGRRDTVESFTASKR